MSRTAFTSISWCKDMRTPELLEIIKSTDIAIYGAGEVGKKLYHILKIHNLHQRVKCFVVSDASVSGRNIEGIPFRAPSDLAGENIFILLAVHEVIKSEIEEHLRMLHLSNHVWIYPNIWEIAFGMPLESHTKVWVRDILRRQQADGYYAVAVRYLAIENYYKKNDIGYRAYVKMQQIHCEEKTAVKRLERFIHLIENWDRCGYREECDIMVDTDSRLFDGLHRFSLACYHQMEKIYARVFPSVSFYDQIVSEKIYINKEALTEHFTRGEREAICDAQARIKGVYMVG